MVTLRGQQNAPIFGAIHPLKSFYCRLWYHRNGRVTGDPSYEREGKERLPPRGPLRQDPARPISCRLLQGLGGEQTASSSQFQRRSGRGEQRSADCRPQHARWAQMDQERRGPINYGVRELENAMPHCVPLELLAEAL
ncbi:uncharacterized protein TrAtP1_008925 [Trichoderma atroviride]|uniref:uncharacterized protein n=1 Tax=Hypocrea atroviridis TaxID=63577 RepID=UPI0033269634|nr:hypothetical protein TrAtP1_008925 [Trichoderma atroviride]